MMNKSLLAITISLGILVLIFTQKLRLAPPHNLINQDPTLVSRLLAQPDAQQTESPTEDKPFLPNPELTPGSVFRQATRQEICVPGYAKRVRHVPPEEKREVYRAYGIRHHRPGEYEMDHLISLELGGDNEPTNLWPEPYFGPWNAHIKDKVENELHRRVCAGTLPLSVAQREIAFDWVAAYRKYVGGQ